MATAPEDKVKQGSCNNSVSDCNRKETKPVENHPVESACCSPKPLIPMVSCCSPVADAGSSCCSIQPSIPLFGAQTTERKEANDCCDSGPNEPGKNFSQKIRIAVQDGWRQFQTVLPYLLVGVFIGALLYGLVPSDFLAAHASGDRLVAGPIAAVIGTPL